MSLQFVAVHLMRLFVRETSLFLINFLGMILSKLFTTMNSFIIFFMKIVLIINRWRYRMLIKQQKGFLIILLHPYARRWLCLMMIILWHIYQQWLLEFFHFLYLLSDLLSIFNLFLIIYLLIFKRIKVLSFFYLNVKCLTYCYKI